MTDNDESKSQPIYLDYNASTPHDPEVVEAMRPFLETHFGNPSSASWYGDICREAVENARRQVASLLGCNTDEIVFTSGGTEANNHAVRGVALAHQRKGNHIITTQIEHPAIIEVCKYLETLGFNVTYLPVDEEGLLNVADLERALLPETILITVMHANNEVGTIQPLERIAKLARKRDIVFHTDAAQSTGKIPTDVNALGVDLLSIAGHKLYAPKGVGALFIRNGTVLEKLMYGAGHEGGRRPGTENVLEIVGLGKACEIARRDLEQNMNQMRTMRDLLHQELNKELDVVLNGHPDERLPNTLSVSLEGIDANQLLAQVGDTLSASTGAACHADSVEVSSVLKAMNVSVERALGTIRFSVGRQTTQGDVEIAVKALSKAVETLKPA